jgi:hypothetical protein
MKVKLREINGSSYLPINKEIKKMLGIIKIVDVIFDSNKLIIYSNDMQKYKIIDYPDYELHYDGNEVKIWSNRKIGKYLTPLNMDGYYKVKLYNQNGFKVIPIAKILYCCLNNLSLDEIISIDHIDRNRKNDNVSNLRLASQSEQCINKNKQNNCSSNYKGVNWRKDRKKWQAYITCNKKTKHLGYYETEEAAAIAYNNQAKILHGDYATLNVIDKED